MAILTLKIVGAIESASLSSEILGDARGFEYREPFGGLKDWELACQRLCQKRVLCLLLALPFVLVSLGRLLFLITSWGLATRGRFNRGSHIDLNVFNVKDARSDLD